MLGYNTVVYLASICIQLYETDSVKENKLRCHTVCNFCANSSVHGNTNNLGSGIWELTGGPWRQHEPAPLSSSQLHVYLLCQRCPRSRYLVFLTCSWSKPWTQGLRERLITPSGLLISCFLSRNVLWPASFGPWAGAHRVHRFLFFFVF